MSWGDSVHAYNYRSAVSGAVQSRPVTDEVGKQLGRLVTAMQTNAGTGVRPYDEFVCLNFMLHTAHA